MPYPHEWATKRRRIATAILDAQLRLDEALVDLHEAEDALRKLEEEFDEADQWIEHWILTGEVHE